MSMFNATELVEDSINAVVLYSNTSAGPSNLQTIMVSLGAILVVYAIILVIDNIYQSLKFKTNWEGNIVILAVVLIIGASLIIGGVTGYNADIASAQEMYDEFIIMYNETYGEFALTEEEIAALAEMIR